MRTLTSGLRRSNAAFGVSTKMDINDPEVDKQSLELLKAERIHARLVL
jgi:hypothetical protein